MHKEARATFQKRLAGDPNVPKRYETFAVRKDGQRIPVDVSIAKTVWRGNPAVLAIARDVSLQKKLEEERARLAANLLEVQEKERQEISAMLHDHLGQLLTLTRLELGSVGSFDSNSKKSIGNAIERLDEALGSVRRLAVSLRPPILDDLGIEVALETLTEEFADGSSIQTAFAHTGPKPILGNAEETCLYRVLQEALTNAAKHSGATRIDVQLRTAGGEVCLEIHDNGKGFDMDAQKNNRGIGFIGMRERLSQCGGALDIISEAEKGTTVLARIPKAGAPGTQEVSP
jgi:two-component system, NarL family, sensor histidine kinase NreB